MEQRPGPAPFRVEVALPGDTSHPSHGRKRKAALHHRLQQLSCAHCILWPLRMDHSRGSGGRVPPGPGRGAWPAPKAGKRRRPDRQPGRSSALPGSRRKCEATPSAVFLVSEKDHQSHVKAPEGVGSSPSRRTSPGHVRASVLLRESTVCPASISRPRLPRISPPSPSRLATRQDAPFLGPPCPQTPQGHSAPNESPQLLSNPPEAG